MKKYTIGALFTPDLEQILLIQKNRPDWQKGRLNLPGGHIEDYEMPSTCVSREFEEETGLIIPAFRWTSIGRIQNDGNYYVEFLTAIYKGETKDIIQHTDEQILWSFTNNIPAHAISNLHWLIPFAKNFHKQGNYDKLKFGIFNYEY